MNPTIALFPLNLVVFPGSFYPLHIFEERYKTLITLSLETENKFGIVFQTDKELAKVGCLVEISEVTRKYNDGKYDIVVHGVERYYILNSFLHPDSYLLARVEPYADSSSEFDRILYESIRDKFLSILEKINVKLETSFFNNLNETVNKSFKLAEKCGLRVDQQQELLTLKNENKRLYFLKEHLEHLDQYIDENKVLKEIVLGDGYINS